MLKYLLAAASISVPIACRAATETTLYTFLGGMDGATPTSQLIADQYGNLYGTTVAGGGTGCGGGGCGTVYKLAPNNNGTGTYSETVLYAFQGGSDGAAPNGRLLIDSARNLYGTTSMGGGCTSALLPGGCGTVFMMTDDGVETQIHAFNGFDGEYPLGGLVVGNDGNLYGTTSAGGKNLFGDRNIPSYGGSVFMVSPPAPPASSWTFSEILAFSNKSKSFPASGLINVGGELYGVLEYGSDQKDCPTCQGLVYQLTPSNNYFLRHIGVFPPENENYSPDGANPYGEVVVDQLGRICGTALNGGQFNPGDNGVLYAFSRNLNRPLYPYVETVLHDFTRFEPNHSYGAVVVDADNRLFGVGSQGGSAGYGGVWEWDGTALTTLWLFTGGADGATPYGGLLAVGTSYVGAATAGGAGYGTVYQITP